MTYNDERQTTFTQADLAHLGEGSVAYLREIGSEELKGKFPGLPDIAPNTKLWALFAANGQPILLVGRARAGDCRGVRERPYPGQHSLTG